MPAMRLMSSKRYNHYEAEKLINAIIMRKNESAIKIIALNAAQAHMPNHQYAKQKPVCII